jgi:hypothetical protein
MVAPKKAADLISCPHCDVWMRRDSIMRSWHFAGDCAAADPGRLSLWGLLPASRLGDA